MSAKQTATAGGLRSRVVSRRRPGPHRAAVGHFESFDHPESASESGHSSRALNYSNKEQREPGLARRSSEVMNYNEDPMVPGDYDPTWPARFSELADRVKAHLGALVMQVEHVGSTAVPGLR